MGINFSQNSLEQIKSIRRKAINSNLCNSEKR